MNQQSWLEWRLQGIGGSDAPVVMGDSPWKTWDQLLQEKVTGIDSIPENANMKYGKEKEEEARLCFEEMTGHIVFPDRRYEHPQFPWIRATLDGIDVDEKIMVEIKNANKADHELAREDKVPPKYFAQCQHQMFVKELEFMFYFSYHKGEGICVTVKRVQSYIDVMFKKHEQFWKEVLLLRSTRSANESISPDLTDLGKRLLKNVSSDV